MGLIKIVVGTMGRKNKRFTHKGRKSKSNTSSNNIYRSHPQQPVQHQTKVKTKTHHKHSRKEDVFVVADQIFGGKYYCIGADTNGSSTTLG